MLIGPDVAIRWTVLGVVAVEAEAVHKVSFLGQADLAAAWAFMSAARADWRSPIRANGHELEICGRSIAIAAAHHNNILGEFIFGNHTHGTGRKQA